MDAVCHAAIAALFDSRDLMQIWTINSEKPSSLYTVFKFGKQACMWLRKTLSTHLLPLWSPSIGTKAQMPSYLIDFWHFRLYLQLLTGCSCLSADIHKVPRQHIGQPPYAVRWLYWTAFETCWQSRVWQICATWCFFAQLIHQLVLEGLDSITSQNPVQITDASASWSELISALHQLSSKQGDLLKIALLLQSDLLHRLCTRESY